MGLFWKEKTLSYNRRNTVFSYCSLDLSANILSADMVFVWDVQYPFVVSHLKGLYSFLWLCCQGSWLSDIHEYRYDKGASVSALIQEIYCYMYLSILVSAFSDLGDSESGIPGLVIWVRTLIIPFRGFPRTRNLSSWTSVKSPKVSVLASCEVATRWSYLG